MPINSINLLVTDPYSLIKEIKEGNSKATGVLIDLYQVKVYNICLSLLHNVEDAEDITQEVFIEILKHISSFRGDSNPGTWIYRIAVNRSLNFIRSNKKKKWLKRLDDILSLTSLEERNTSGYTSHLELNEQKEVLQSAINKLPENQRIAFSLNKIDDLNYKEVAEIMGISHSAVESLLHRAKVNLQKSLEKYFSG
ncbi:MAG: RNA polymerase sigma factor [Omnitrophica WOR_2 bacterium]